MLHPPSGNNILLILVPPFQEQERREVFGLHSELEKIKRGRQRPRNPMMDERNDCKLCIPRHGMGQIHKGEMRISIPKASSLME